MTTISLPLPGNVLHTTPQTLDFDKIATFISGNGSGKSSILKSIFDEKLKPASTLYDGYKIVCFSSGQNESYSSIYFYFKMNMFDLRGIDEAYGSGKKTKKTTG